MLTTIFFGRKARENGDARFPVQSERSEYRFAAFAQAAEVGVFIMGRCIAVVIGTLRVVAQEPDDDRGYENHSAHLLQILGAFVPHVREGRFPRRQSVGGQFHDERRFVHRKEEPAHQPGCQNSHGDACQVEPRHHQYGMRGEKKYRSVADKWVFVRCMT